MDIATTDSGFTIDITNAEANVLASLLREVGGDAENEVLFRIYEALTVRGVPGNLPVEAVENTEEEREFYPEQLDPALSASHRLVV